MKRVSRWAPSVAWMMVIFFFSSRARVQVSEQDAINFLFFKTLHVIEYAILFLLNVRALTKPNFLAAAIFTLAYAIIDEIHQLFVPTREGRLRDVIIDGIGVLIAWMILIQLRQKVLRRPHKKVSGWLIRAFHSFVYTESWGAERPHLRKGLPKD